MTTLCVSNAFWPTENLPEILLCIIKIESGWVDEYLILSMWDHMLWFILKPWGHIKSTQSAIPWAKNSLGLPLWAGNTAGEIYTRKTGEERSVHGHDPSNIVADLWKDHV